MVTSNRILRILAIEYAILETSLYLESTTIKPLVELAKRQHQVTLFAPTVSQSIRRSTVPTFNLELVQLGKQLPFLSLVYFELAAFCRLLASISNVDAIIVDFNSLPMLFPVLFLRRLCSPTPMLLLHIESNIVDMGNALRTAFLTFIDALSAKLASIAFDAILFSTPMLGKLYNQLYRVPRQKIGVWPNAVESNFSKSVDASRVAHLRRELGLVGRIGFLYLGALRINGVLELVHAFRILKESSVNVILVLLGYGESREFFLRYIPQHHLDSIVKLRGPVEHSEVPTYIAACDVGITTMPDHIDYRYQNPIKILELLAMNKPIIVSDIPANRWIIGNEPVAIYLKGTDPLSIAEGVREFLASLNNLDPRLGEQIVGQRFTPEKVADTLQNQIASYLRKASIHHSQQE